MFLGNPLFPMIAVRYGCLKLQVPEATHKAWLLGGESRANLLETLKKVNFDQVLGAKLGDMLFCFSKSVKLNYIYGI